MDPRGGAALIRVKTATNKSSNIHITQHTRRTCFSRKGDAENQTAKGTFKKKLTPSGKKNTFLADKLSSDFEDMRGLKLWLEEYLVMLQPPMLSDR